MEYFRMASSARFAQSPVLVPQSDIALGHGICTTNGTTNVFIFNKPCEQCRPKFITELASLVNTFCAFKGEMEAGELHTLNITVSIFNVCENTLPKNVADSNVFKRHPFIC